MLVIQYREATTLDIPAMAKLRAQVWGTEEYWKERIAGYMSGEIHPQEALVPRVLYAATKEGTVLGFIAGHLTSRHECNGELEWIDIMAKYKRKGIGSTLVQLLAVWFIEQKAVKVCVDVDPANTVARSFYKHHGAEPLDTHWLVWKDISSVL
jgi:ribosomal protein S18 acetylase RimI-like enzyme